MEILFSTRGANHVRDTWVSFMQSQFFPFKRKNLKTGKIHLNRVQGVLRPLELWTYVFPKEFLNEVVTATGCLNKDGTMNSDWSGSKAMMLPFLRKALGFKQFPKLEYKPTNLPMSINGFGPSMIGVKEDRYGIWEGWQPDPNKPGSFKYGKWEQELL